MNCYFLWQLGTINIYLIKNFLDNYLSAQKKCEIAKCKSDLSSAEDIIKKRKKFKNKKQVSSSESGMFIVMVCILYQTEYFILQFLLDCEESDDNMSKGSIPRYLSGNTFTYFIIFYH